MDFQTKNKNKSATVRSLVGMFALFMVFTAQSIPLLYDIRYSPIVKGETELEFVFDEELYADPNVQVYNEPARIEMFFDETDFEESLANVLIEKDGVINVETQYMDDGVMVSILLDYLKIYQSRVEGNRFFIRVSDNASLEAQAQQDTAITLINRIQALDFRRGTDPGQETEGRVLVFLRDNMAAVDVTSSDNQIFIEFHNTDIVNELLYKMDVTDFGTVVGGIETFQVGVNTRLVVNVDGEFEYDFQQLDNIFTLSVIKAAEQQGILAGGTEYQGQPISLNFQDLPIRTVLQIIADYNGFNLVVSDTVSGSLTLRLNGVPWDQALDIVLKTKGLDKRMDGNVLMVAPADELTAREARELEARKKVEENEPLVSEFIQINYAKAVNIAALLKSDGTSILTPRGQVSVDDRTNTLLVKDTFDGIETVKKAVRTLDIPIKQVIIEARMVTIRDNIDEQLGIRWGITDRNAPSSGYTSGISGSLDGAGSANYNQDTATAGGDQTSVLAIPVAQRLNVNLPVASPAGSIAVQIARLADGTLLDLELSALERENKGEIVATPRITASNQKMSRIEQGTEIPYVQAASSGATTVTFKKAVLSLEVTPQITPDNSVILDLNITQDARGDTVSTPTGPAVAIDTQQLQTQVTAVNGETIVLGGIYQQQVINSVSKVPLLGDLPFIGRLFRTDTSFNEKRELLIFVTPKIVTDAL
ncbi:type IV pilus secretin PilQ family protein [Psychrosphaera sp. B3R10]|uniref:type IV pilus secretin PilQ n=1 Tax=unclassified Psychrosphaera TaxID=2641570 RepID=UPI001C097D53|nr:MULTISPECIES: type IV pilus secretin PilQ family protein [unclassified Psychrosphaera]MBU2881091.1 type IV pilus secretin PilQ family protein [Psychrosphaera sp. I2R16]MBU2990015.1 type IV pilus secretin PilQ family protein [Psychrosphaera sp. B3R10]